MITVEASNEVVNELLDIADKHGISYDSYDGVLLDNYIMHNAEIINIGKNNARYIIVEETCLNEWSSGTRLILTNSYDEMMSYETEFKNRISEIEIKYLLSQNMS
ncbi:hypothetical protein [Paenibacillus gallinarum]|uniref:Uncharacterized protein n=1 Tax=Paenibacillus gallinarum TaxID=2762232 RepID=A0ABR8T3T0_9BACL|nr:hypothetical protein [Paenibacillus gallinarum]MBD7970245.1 hypothetical protein [Paenibacillus gallinarum]